MRSDSSVHIDTPDLVQLTLFNDGPPPARKARNDIRLGDAAEMFVIAKLLKAGFDAHSARRDAPYDVGVDLGTGRYCRVQVKGRERERAQSGKWEFRFVRGNPRTGAGTYAYANTDFDITACVALSLERVVFFPGVHVSIRLSTADFLRPDNETHVFTMDPFWSKAAVILSAMPTGANAYVVAQQYNVHVETASSVVVVSTGMSVVTISVLLIWLWVGGASCS